MKPVKRTPKAAGLVLLVVHKVATVPHHRCSRFGRRAFSVAGPMVWNMLPDHLHDPSLRIGSFRLALQTFLFTTHRYT